MSAQAQVGTVDALALRARRLQAAPEAGARMRARSHLVPVILLWTTLCLAWSPPLQAQSETPVAVAALSGAHEPQMARNQLPAPPVQATHAAEQSSSSVPASSSSESQVPQHQKAEEQIRQQEHQRVAGIVPQFNVSYVSNAASLSPGQKMRLAFRSAIDPFNFAAAAFVAGYHQLNDDDPGFGPGAEGFAKGTGAAYLDSFNANIIGNGVLPVILRQDPRYFRRGHGAFPLRLSYAAATSFVCKHDTTGQWEPNYSNVLGNIAAGGISNLYYPSQNAGWRQAISNGLIVTIEGMVGGMFQEFWPDISRRLLHQDPTHGLDAQRRAAEAARKQAKTQTRQ